MDNIVRVLYYPWLKFVMQGSNSSGERGRLPIFF